MVDYRQPIDRRTERRASVRAPIVLHRNGSQGNNLTEEAVTANVSLGGVYFESPLGADYTTNELVVVSISIPAAEQGKFPFSRLAGRSRVVRVDALPKEEGSDTRYGVALQFGEHLSVLSGIPEP